MNFAHTGVPTSLKDSLRKPRLLCICRSIGWSER